MCCSKESVALDSFLALLSFSAFRSLLVNFRHPMLSWQTVEGVCIQSLTLSLVPPFTKRKKTHKFFHCGWLVARQHGPQVKQWWLRLKRLLGNPSLVGFTEPRCFKYTHARPQNTTTIRDTGFKWFQFSLNQFSHRNQISQCKQNFTGTVSGVLLFWNERRWTVNLSELAATTERT